MNKEEKKVILNYQTGLKLFVFLILAGLIVFGIFFLIQNKKDEEFQKSRQGGLLQMSEEYINKSEEIKNKQ